MKGPSVKTIKKILPLILASTLTTSFFVNCSKEGLSKHKKHLIVGAYSVLGAYSAKRAWVLFLKTISVTILKEDFQILFPKPFCNGYAFRYTMWPYLATYLFNIARLSVFSYITYFSVKNIIQELKNKNRDKETKKKTILA